MARILERELRKPSLEHRANSGRGMGRVIRALTRGTFADGQVVVTNEEVLTLQHVRQGVPPPSLVHLKNHARAVQQCHVGRYGVEDRHERVRPVERIAAGVGSSQDVVWRDSHVGYV